MNNIKLIGNISVPSTKEDKLNLAKNFKELGVDELIYTGEGSYETYVDEIKFITDNIDLPLNVCIKATKFDDVKYTLYAGASRVAIYDPIGKNSLLDLELVNESSLRFGKEKIFINIGFTEEGNLEISDSKEYKIFGAGGVFIDGYKAANHEELKTFIDEVDLPIGVNVSNISKEDTKNILNLGVNTFIVDSISTKTYIDELKNLIQDGQSSCSYMSFSEFKLNQDGLIPVIVQDYKTDEVLMMAYMNEEAYNKTLETGTMTYFSRSRSSLWVKGETSGHFQYVQKLSIDCDKDTLLAKVKQIGVACHTGNPTCFFTDILKKDYDDTNPLKVFQEEYDIILDRKNNPKEGSYTNYLFDKGVDKILKKVGEEATEIVIAAKNPDNEELKYELADFLYHAMVLMVEQGVTWDEVVEAIAKRR
ncbi:MAG: bifunctional phosphoribosyl-AMP cyclohydrolase/phosphoribosyl-ATP diphosphatase HisIE [Lachnospiraceae bacterium]|nr:bifunctional phosphoribosyl-AMP cyclohydrolase/phosphoribosyl-ATP diphosphatase HisIE [Lachnospiraceae bacterium]